MILKEVYHASQMQGLAQIQPSISSHNEKWIYATKDLIMAAAFLSTTGGDFTCAVGRDEESGKAFICERFQGAFDLRYAGVKGSIYVLLALAIEGKLILRYYPEKIACIPEDDEDLVYRAAIWYKQFGEKIIAQVKRYHPGLLSRVKQAIKE